MPNLLLVMCRNRVAAEDIADAARRMVPDLGVGMTASLDEARAWLARVGPPDWAVLDVGYRALMADPMGPMLQTVGARCLLLGQQAEEGDSGGYAVLESPFTDAALDRVLRRLLACKG